MPDKRLLMLAWHPHTKGSTRALWESLPKAGFMMRNEWRKPHAERDIWPTLARELDAFPPEYAVYFQRLYPSDKQLRDMLEKHKVKQVCMDLAPIPFRHYESAIFDPKGDNAASSIAGGLDKWLAHSAQRAAIDERLKDVDRQRGEIRLYAKDFVERGGFEPGVKDLDLPDDFIFMALQMPHDQVVRHDSDYSGEDCMMRLAEEAIAEAERRGRFVVIKPHPLERKWEWNKPERGAHYLVLPKIKGMRAKPGESQITLNDNLCAYLWHHCAKCIVVNSTMLFGALFAGKSVAMLGRGWATGNGVVQECKSMAEAFEDYEPDAERVQRFLALILSRCRTHQQLRDPVRAKQLFDFLDSLRGAHQYVAPRAPTIIRTIFIGNQRQLDVVKYCLRHTVNKNPDSRIILAIDKADAAFEKWALELSPKIETLRMEHGRPPRMNLLMGEALKRIPVQDKWVITAEQDTIFHGKIMAKMQELLEQGGPRAAAVQAESCLFNARRCYPSIHVTNRHKVKDGAHIDEKTPETTHATFSTTLWRNAALRAIDWQRTRRHTGADLDAANQIKPGGWRFYQTFHVKAIHQSHTIIRDGFGRINGLHNKHKDRACYIIGKGPSLDSVTAETFERDCPIICLNESIHIIEALEIDNPVYVIQQDAALKESCKPKRGMLLLAGLCKRHYKTFARKIIHTPADFGVKRKNYWPHSSLVAVKYARIFGCAELRMVGFDQLVSGDCSYAESIKDASLIPQSANLRMNNELLIDEIGKLSATWLGDNGDGFVRLGKDVLRHKKAFADIIQDGEWKDRRCFIVGGGPSLEGFDWSLLDGELVIAVNRGFEFCNPNIIVSCDADFMRWIEGKRDDGDGLCPKETARRFWDLKCLRAMVDVPKQKYDFPAGLNLLRYAGNDGLSKSLRDGIVCGRNSGFAAMSLAMLLGANPIYLLGFDMQHRPSDDKAHFYDKGKPGRPQDSYHKYYRHYFDKVAPEIKARGHQVINLSPNSALECFEKGEFPEPSTRPIYISYYTLDSPYEKEVDNLVTSLIQHGLPYELWPMKSLGSWEANCRLCPTVCREAMEDYPNRPIVFLDADSIVRQAPELLENMPSDIDFAVAYIKFHPRQPKKLGAACLYFAPTAKALGLVKEWERRCKLDRARGDSEILQEIIDEDEWGGKWLNLPGTYCKVFDNHAQDGAGEPPIIEEFQASRRFKTAIKNSEATEKAKYENLWRSEKYQPSKTQATIVSALMGSGYANGKILELGCGNGVATEALINHGLDAQGADITLEGLVVNRNGHYTEAPLWNMPFEDNAFDMTFSTDVLEHLPPDKVLDSIEEIMRVTKGITIHVIANFSCTSYGQELHLTQQPIEWWRKQFNSFADAGCKVVLCDRKEFMVSGFNSFTREKCYAV